MGKNKPKVGDCFEVHYTDNEEVTCPICGFNNPTNFDLEDLRGCDNCGSKFKSYNVMELEELQTPKYAVRMENRVWKIKKLNKSDKK
jgi:hypothetical protein